MRLSSVSVLGLFTCTLAAEEGPDRSWRQQEKETWREEQKFLKLSELLIFNK